MVNRTSALAPARRTAAADAGEADAARARAYRRYKKQAVQRAERPQRHACNLRNEVHVTQRGGGKLQHHWKPRSSDFLGMRQGTHDDDPAYVLLAISFTAVSPMACWLAPRLQEATGLTFLSRTTSDGGRRGATIFLSRGPSTSGAHRDPDASLLLVVAKMRTLWLADCDRFVDDRKHGDDSGTQWLEDELDPVQHPMARAGWQRVDLHAGDAIYIGRGEWHSVAGELGGVAVSIEVAHKRCGFTVWRGVGPSRPVGGWTSAAAVLQLFHRCTGTAVPLLTVRNSILVSAGYTNESQLEAVR